MSYHNRTINYHITLFNYIALLKFGLKDAIQFPFAKIIHGHKFLLSLSMETDYSEWL